MQGQEDVIDEEGEEQMEDTGVLNQNGEDQVDDDQGEDIEGMEQEVEEDEMEGRGEDEMEVPEGLDEEMDDGEHYEDDEENLMIDEHQLAALIEQYERQKQGLPTEPIYDENGELIQLNEEEYEAACKHYEAMLAGEMQIQDEEQDD